MNRLQAILGVSARWAARGLARFYYSRIEISGRDQVPASGPLLLVANHPNSVLDPPVIGLTARRPVHFLAKAPLFKLPVFGQILYGLGMIPAYRAVDDRSQVTQNMASLEAAARFLAKGEVVGLFPEGKSHDALKVDQVRSGAARIALQAVQAGAQGLKIVPLGINYERKERFRSAVWVRVGAPIDVADWLKSAGAPERHAHRLLTAEIDRRLKALAIHLNEERWEPYLGDLESLVPSPVSRLRDPIAVLRQRKRIADAVNHFTAVDRPRAEAMASAVLEHRTRVAAAGLDLGSDLFRLGGARLVFRQLIELLWLLVGLGPALSGTVYNLLPFAVSRAIAPRVQPPGRMTMATTRLLLGIPIYGLWYGGLGWWTSRYFLPWVAWTVGTVLFFCGMFALHYWPRAVEAMRTWWQELRSAIQRHVLARLRSERGGLVQQLTELGAEYGRVRPADALEPPVPTTGRALLRFGTRAALATVTLVLVLWSAERFRSHVLPELRYGGPRLAGLDGKALEPLLRADENGLADVLQNVAELARRVDRIRLEFAGGQRSFLRQADDDAVRQLLLTFLSLRAELLTLTWRYQNYGEIREEPFRLRAFLLAMTAASTLFDNSSRFVAMFAERPEVVRKLNEAEPAMSIPAGIYDRIQANVSEARHRRLMEMAYADYDRWQAGFRRHGLLEAAPQRGFHAAVVKARPLLDREVPGAEPGSLAFAVKQALQLGRRAVYTGQSTVSTLLSSTRFRNPRQGSSLIRPGQLARLRELLRPGDILLERQEGYLTRVFMPGYWAHAALYVGTRADLQRLGLDRDPRVAAHWRQFAGRDEDGHLFAIIEAAPRGVGMATLEDCIGIADSAAVLRPRLGEGAIREAIARAFTHLGKSYDFDFDFLSSDRLVCTELVYRCYDGQLRLPLVDVLGRKTMPPSELVGKFARELGQDGAELEFVAFLDGREALGFAQFSDARGLAETTRRTSVTLFAE